jgi:YVTN family beta-propeller protein
MNSGKKNMSYSLTKIAATCILLAALAFLGGCGGSQSTSTSAATPAKVIATIPLGMSPGPVDVNPSTNRVYVANMNDKPGTVSVIDAVGNTVMATVLVGSSPDAIAVNPVTNKIYVADHDDATVDVIDGATNQTMSVGVGTYPVAIAVNSVTDSIYVSNFGDATVTVIDGATNNTVTIPVPPTPSSIAVNSVTNKIYILNEQNSSVTALDGATNHTAVVAVGGIALGIAVDSTRNKIYVSCDTVETSEVDVIDGVTLGVTAADVNNPAGGPGAIAVNATTNKIYVSQGNAVAVIDGATLVVSTLTPQLADFIAIDPGINQIYLLAGTTVTVIDGTTNSPTTLNLSFAGLQAAVNLITHRVYVTIECTSNVTCRYPTPGTVSVIEAAH